MTVKEAILSYPGLSDISDDFAEKIIADRSLTGADIYSSTHKTVVALAAADLYVAVANSPDFSEGKLSVKHAREQLLSYARHLYQDNGESTKADKLKHGRGNAKANWW